MKRLLVTLALTCVLSASAMAGTIPTMGAPEPGETSTPPIPVTGDIPSVNSTAPGDVPTVGLSALLALLDLAF